MLTVVVVLPVPPLWLKTARRLGAASFFSFSVTRGPDSGATDGDACSDGGAGEDSGGELTVAATGAIATGAGGGVPTRMGAGVGTTPFMAPSLSPPASWRSCPRHPSEQAYRASP